MAGQAQGVQADARRLQRAAGWAEDPILGRWVNKQRAGRKALDRGEPSKGMTAARAAKLETLSFAWAPRAVESEAKAAAEEDAEEEEAEAEALAPGAAVAGRPVGRPGGRERRAPTRWSLDPLPAASLGGSDTDVAPAPGVAPPACAACSGKHVRHTCGKGVRASRR
jgi:hypothetical protein